MTDRQFNIATILCMLGVAFGAALVYLAQTGKEEKIAACMAAAVLIIYTGATWMYAQRLGCDECQERRELAEFNSYDESAARCERPGRGV